MPQSIIDDKGREIVVHKNNPRLKAMYNDDIAFTQHEAMEMYRCQKDPIYFIRNYMKIVNVDRGYIPFDMYDFQEEMVETYNENRFCVTLCPRQVGKSTVVVAYMLWYILFHEEKKCCILAHKAQQSRELLNRLRRAYMSIPLWMQQGVARWNQGDIELENGSKIVAASTSSDSIRGDTFNLIFLDEFAHVPNHVAEDFFASVYPTIASGKTTKCIIVSTPKGMNHFYKIWADAKEGRNEYIPFRVHWQDVPGRDKAWKDQTIANTSQRQFDQEMECEFLGSSGTLIDGYTLRNLVYREPIYTYSDDSGSSERKDCIKIYAEPEKDRTYVMTVDSGKGLGQDYSAISVFDVTEVPYKQVAVFRDNRISHLIYPNVIKKLGRMYNHAYCLIELNDVGTEVANILFSDLEYEEVFMIENRGRKGQQISTGVGVSPQQMKLGVTQSVATKNIGCANLKSLIEDNKLIVEDINTIQELSTFVEDGKSFGAEEGEHDDLAMTLVMFAWLTSQEFFKELTDTDVREKLYAERQRKIEEDMLPMFVDDGMDYFYDDIDSGPSNGEFDFGFGDDTGW